MLDSDKKVLSYNDVLLRRADVELLTGPRWLNDQVISFYFEYITQERLQGGHQSVVFVPPSISFLLANCGEDGEDEPRLCHLRHLGNISDPLLPR